MIDRLMHFSINLACACIFALVGGYILASIIAFSTTALLNFFGSNSTVESTINSSFGFAVLILSVLFFGVLGYFIGDILQNKFNILCKNTFQ